MSDHHASINRSLEKLQLYAASSIRFFELEGSVVEYLWQAAVGVWFRWKFVWKMMRLAHAKPIVAKLGPRATSFFAYDATLVLAC